jgi:hypothetical protein
MRLRVAINEMAHLPGHRPEAKTKKRLFPVKWSRLFGNFFELLLNY